MKRSLLLLHSSLIIALLLSALIQLLPWSLIHSTFVGMLIAAVGGFVSGLISRRYLGHSQNNQETILGIAAVVVIGVMTIGYIYLVHIKGPMSSIGTLHRTIEQTFIFLEFLVAQASGSAFTLHKRATAK